MYKYKKEGKNGFPDETGCGPLGSTYFDYNFCPLSEQTIS